MLVPISHKITVVSGNIKTFLRFNYVEKFQNVLGKSVLKSRPLNYPSGNASELSARRERSVLFTRNLGLVDSYLQDRPASPGRLERYNTKRRKLLK